MTNWPVALFHAALLTKYAAALVLLMLTEYRGQLLLLLLEDQVAALPCVVVPVSPVTVRVGVHCIRIGKEASMVREIVFFAQGSLLDWNALHLQSLTVVIVSLSVNASVGHDAHIDCAGLLYFPASQFSQPSDPTFSLNLPDVHLVQDPPSGPE
jgi:hypothetical protein